MRTYKTYDHAVRRVNYLIHNAGVWPGIQRMTNGRYRLTYDVDEWLYESE